MKNNKNDDLILGKMDINGKSAKNNNKNEKKIKKLYKKVKNYHQKINCKLIK